MSTSRRKDTARLAEAAATAPSDAAPTETHLVVPPPGALLHAEAAPLVLGGEAVLREVLDERLGEVDVAILELVVCGAVCGSSVSPRMHRNKLPSRLGRRQTPTDNPAPPRRGKGQSCAAVVATCGLFRGTRALGQPLEHPGMRHTHPQASHRLHRASRPYIAEHPPETAPTGCRHSGDAPEYLALYQISCWYFSTALRRSSAGGIARLASEAGVRRRLSGRVGNRHVHSKCTGSWSTLAGRPERVCVVAAGGEFFSLRHFFALCSRTLGRPFWRG